MVDLAPVPCHFTGGNFGDYQDLGLQAKRGRFRVLAGPDVSVACRCLETASSRRRCGRRERNMERKPERRSDSLQHAFKLMGTVE